MIGDTEAHSRPHLTLYLVIVTVGRHQKLRFSGRKGVLFWSTIPRSVSSKLLVGRKAAIVLQRSIVRIEWFDLTNRRAGQMRRRKIIDFKDIMQLPICAPVRHLDELVDGEIL